MTARPQEITQKYLTDLDNHLLDIVEGRATEMLELKSFAEMQFIHPIHFSNTIKDATGLHPCYFYEEKIMNIAKAMLQDNKMTIGAIAALLTYDPSNFTKFFKRFGNLYGQNKKYALDQIFELVTQLKQTSL